MNKDDLKEILSKFTYGLYIASSGNCGCVIDTACQVTSANSDLNIITVSMNMKNETTKEIIKNGKVCLSLLSETTPLETIELFGYKSSRDINKFEFVNTASYNSHKFIAEHTLAFMYGDVYDTMTIDNYIVIAIKLDHWLCIDKENKPLTYEKYKETIKNRETDK